MFPILDRALEGTIPSEYPENESFDADVTNALLERVDKEYTAAINDSGDVVEYCEYWDARGFIVQANARYDEEITRRSIPWHARRPTTRSPNCR